MIIMLTIFGMILSMETTKDTAGCLILVVVTIYEYKNTKEFFIIEVLKDFIKVTSQNQESRKIGLFLLINLTFMFIELIYGYISNSLGLIADSFHMLFDSTGLLISLIAKYISQLPSNS
jgi:Co/Zn/Cd efflux system component